MRDWPVGSLGWDPALLCGEAWCFLLGVRFWDEAGLCQAFCVYNDYPVHSGGKGRSKREMEQNTNRPLPSGHERKIAEKLRNSEMKRKRARSLSS
uniref:Nuclear protein 1 n=1 Tax=Callorhinchus milii TaxID=7868 RepID=A0A4W3ICF5_CALMI